MSDYELNVIKTLEYKRPEIDKGYADQTLSVDISNQEMAIKPVEPKIMNQKSKTYLSAAKGMISGCSGMRSSRLPAGMTRQMPSASPQDRWGVRPSTRVPAKASSPPCRP
jgi:hypothetical protein